MGFDLSAYEDVASLNRWFQDNYPMGSLRILEWKHDDKKDEIHFIVGVYRDINDQWPAVMNYARGKQEEYNRNMARFYGEDAITSAYGRAIALLKASEKTAHREGMERALENAPNKWEKRVTEKIAVEKPSDPWTIENKDMPLPVADAVAAINDNVVPEQVPTCQKHQRPMMPRTGNKNGKAWKHYKCAGNWPDVCEEIIWMEIDKTGRWVPQKPRPTQGAIN